MYGENLCTLPIGDDFPVGACGEVDEAAKLLQGGGGGGCFCVSSFCVEEVEEGAEGEGEGRRPAEEGPCDRHDGAVEALKFKSAGCGVHKREHRMDSSLRFVQAEAAVEGRVHRPRISSASER